MAVSRATQPRCSRPIEGCTACATSSMDLAWVATIPSFSLTILVSHGLTAPVARRSTQIIECFDCPTQAGHAGRLASAAACGQSRAVAVSTDKIKNLFEKRGKFFNTPIVPSRTNTPSQSRRPTTMSDNSIFSGILENRGGKPD